MNGQAGGRTDVGRIDETDGRMMEKYCMAG